MERVNVLNEILNWSQSRPPWQRDALRRLVLKGDLDEDDIRELANLCKSRHGLVDRENPVPLKANHLPTPGTEAKPAFLKSLTHHAGVNALAQDQTIEFGPSLTVVYGANAAGKSGYTSILKRACRARGAEEILGNVVSGTAPRRPSATIKFAVDDVSCEHLWDDQQPANRFLSRVSVFDHHCAGVYVTQRTDVAFRPMGLDLFDKLSAACEAVKKVLEKDRSALEVEELNVPDINERTAVHDLLLNLTSLTDPAEVKKLATLTACEKQRRDEIRGRIRDLTSEDPQKIARTIELHVVRARMLLDSVTNAETVLSNAEIAGLSAAHARTIETKRVLNTTQNQAFQEQPLSDTGSVTWRILWKAAEQFSTRDAYPDHTFPYTGKDARCVLCQQELGTEAVYRLQKFSESFNSTAQIEYDRATTEYDQKGKHIDEAIFLDERALVTLGACRSTQQDESFV